MARKPKQKTSKDEFFDAIRQEVSAAGVEMCNVTIKRRGAKSNDWSFVEGSPMTDQSVGIFNFAEPGNIVDICRQRWGKNAFYEVTASHQSWKSEISCVLPVDIDMGGDQQPPQDAIPVNPYGLPTAPTPQITPSQASRYPQQPQAYYYPQNAPPPGYVQFPAGFQQDNSAREEAANLRAELDALKRENARIEKEHSEERHKLDLALADEKHKGEMRDAEARMDKKLDELKATLKPKEDTGKASDAIEIERMKLQQEAARLQADNQWRQTEATLKASDQNLTRIMDGMKADREAQIKIAEIREEMRKYEIEMRDKMNDPNRMAEMQNATGKFLANMTNFSLNLLERVGDSQPPDKSATAMVVKQVIDGIKDVAKNFAPQLPPAMLPRSPIQAVAQPSAPMGNLPAGGQPPQPQLQANAPIPVGPNGLVPMREAKSIVDAVMLNVIDNLTAKIDPAKLASLIYNHLAYLSSIGALPNEIKGIFDDPQANLTKLSMHYTAKTGQSIDEAYFSAVVEEFKKVLEKDEEGNGEGTDSEDGTVSQEASNVAVQ